MKSGVKFLENRRCHEIEFFGNGITFNYTFYLYFLRKKPIMKKL